LQGYLDQLAGGTPSLGPIRVHPLEDIREAHADLEHNRTFGKHVVLTHPDDRLAHRLLRPRTHPAHDDAGNPALT
jgi:hypothetical protein